MLRQQLDALPRRRARATTLGQPTIRQALTARFSHAAQKGWQPRLQRVQHQTYRHPHHEQRQRCFSNFSPRDPMPPDIQHRTINRLLHRVLGARKGVLVRLCLSLVVVYICGDDIWVALMRRLIAVQYSLVGVILRKEDEARGLADSQVSLAVRCMARTAIMSFGYKQMEVLKPERSSETEVSLGAAAGPFFHEGTAVVLPVGPGNWSTRVAQDIFVVTTQLGVGGRETTQRPKLKGWQWLFWWKKLRLVEPNEITRHLISCAHATADQLCDSGKLRSDQPRRLWIWTNDGNVFAVFTIHSFMSQTLKGQYGKAFLVFRGP